MQSSCAPHPPRQITLLPWASLLSSVKGKFRFRCLLRFSSSNILGSWNPPWVKQKAPRSCPGPHPCPSGARREHTQGQDGGEGSGPVEHWSFMDLGLRSACWVGPGWKEWASLPQISPCLSACLTGCYFTLLTTSQGGEGKGRWAAADAIGGGTDASLCGSSKTEQRSAGPGPPGLQLQGSALCSFSFLFFLDSFSWNGVYSRVVRANTLTLLC